jgi:hypothetical protein
MNGPDITLTQEELDNLKSIQNKFTMLSLRLGELHYERNVIDRDISAIESSLVELEESRDATFNALQEKYGQGRLDIDSGKFIPAN